MKSSMSITNIIFTAIRDTLMRRTIIMPTIVFIKAIIMPKMAFITATVIPKTATPNKIKIMQCRRKSIRISTVENANISSKRRLLKLM